MNGVDVLVRCVCAVIYLPVHVQTYENLALKKPAWQSSTWTAGDCRNGCWADRAVDGRASNLSAEGGQCAVSNKGPTAEWRVDLGGVLSIHHIFIQYMTDNQVWDRYNPLTGSFLGFSLYLSNTTNKDDGVLCFKDTNYSRNTIPNSTNITCRLHGRYIIYYNNRTYPRGWYSDYARIYLCEVEVYDCPSPGYYGDNCYLKCPQNCQNGYCDSLEGTCLDCVPGYTGSKCNERCDGRTFGQDCAESCGKCVRGEQCHHENGTCLDGCVRGYHGITCTEECPQGAYGYDCQERCSLTCGVPGRCDSKTGTCNDGCQTEWKSPKCDTSVGLLNIGFYIYIVVGTLAVFLSTAVVVIIYQRRRMSASLREILNSENDQRQIQAPAPIELAIENFHYLAIPEDRNSYTILASQLEEDPPYDELPK